MIQNTLHVFDIDGTLTDSVPMYLAAVTNAMKAVGITDIDTDFNAYKHHTDSYALRYNYEKNFDNPYPSTLLEAFEAEVVTQISLFDTVNEIVGAKSLIQYFIKNNIPFCFATGSLPKPSLLKLEDCEIWYDQKLLATSKYFETREGFVLDAIEKAKRYYDTSNFENVISLGDGLWDLKTAQNLEIDFVGIGDKNKSILQNNGAKQCFSDLKKYKEQLF